MQRGLSQGHALQGHTRASAAPSGMIRVRCPKMTPRALSDVSAANLFGYGETPAWSSAIDYWPSLGHAGLSINCSEPMGGSIECR
jgi:hypothetical protein